MVKGKNGHSPWLWIYKKKKETPYVIIIMEKANVTPNPLPDWSEGVDDSTGFTSNHYLIKKISPA